MACRLRWLGGVLLGLAAAGCGRDAPRQYEVVGRSADWRVETAAPGSAAPLSMSWPVGAPGTAGIWRTELQADATLVVTGPYGKTVRPDVHHALTIEAAPRAPCALRVGWRDSRQDFADERSVSGFELQPDGGQGVWVVPLSGLRGVGDAPDARDGVELFELRFSSADGGAPDIALQSIGLRSEYDAPDGGSPRSQRLELAGASRQGIAARLPARGPARLAAELPLRVGDRVHLGLALAGSDAPLAAVVLAGSARREVRLQPGDGWSEVSLDITERDVETVRIEAGPAPDGDAVLLVGGPLHLRPAERALPDVILYVEDTLRADRLGTYGYGRPTDPALARIAAQGAVFTRAVSPSNWTRPSSSSLLTSLVPSAHGNQTHRQRIAPELDTLAETLAAQGYVTLSFVSNYHAGEWSGLDQGFDVQREPAAFGLPLAPDTLTSGRIHPALIAALDDWPEVATFVFVQSLDPHAPYRPTPEAAAALYDGRLDLPGPAAGESTDSRAYDAEIRHNDGWIGKLDQALAAHGRADDTLFVFTSDHGEGFGEHGHVQHHETLYQEELAVPLVLRWPAAIRAGLRLDDPVSLIDVAPTIAGLIGVAAPPTWAGRDLSARLRGTAPRAAEPIPILVQSVAGAGQPPGEQVAVLLAPWKLLLVVRDGRAVPSQLFELQDDPDERHDVLSDPAHAVLIARLTAVAQQALDAGPLVAGEHAAAPMDSATRDWMAEMGYLR